MNTTLYLFVTIAVFILAGLTAGHALLYKRDPKGAMGWIAVCIIFPVAGPLLYFLFGVNRIKTTAKQLDKKWPVLVDTGHEASMSSNSPLFDVDLSPELKGIITISDSLARRPLVGGNEVTLLHTGDKAYPAMLEAISQAKRSMYLSSYIFSTDEIGKQFVAAMDGAVRRGVDVRVLVDGFGEKYSIPWVRKLLKKHSIRHGIFLPPKLIPPSLTMNLRNHKKILIIDGCIGFTGGMNITNKNITQPGKEQPKIIDTHFQLKGPIASQMEQVFLEDWVFVTSEYTPPPPVPLQQEGGCYARALVDGPNMDLDKISLVLQGAISAARKRISIMTPYFIPSRDIIAGLKTAALRGVDVQILLPSKNNLPFVKWATSNLLWELLEVGVKVFMQPPPFVHSKLFVVDSVYSQVGSANIDPRSFRLNFELMIELISGDLATSLEAYFDKARGMSRQVTFHEVENRSTLTRIRDSICWLFSPYL